MSRTCICRKDLQVVTVNRERYRRTIIKAIKECLNKETLYLVSYYRRFLRLYELLFS